MSNNEIPKKLKELIAQYGIPTPELTPRFKSLLQDVFVDNPREMNLLITGLDDDIPGQLQAKKGTVPYEILSGQMIDRLYTNRGMDRQAAEWVVRTWAGALGYDVPTQRNESKTKINGYTVSTPSNKKKKKLTGQQGERVYFPDIPDTGQKEISPKNASEKKESYTRVSEPGKNTSSPLIILGILGLVGIVAILLFGMGGVVSSYVTTSVPDPVQSSHTPIPSPTRSAITPTAIPTQTQKIPDKPIPLYQARDITKPGTYYLANDITGSLTIKTSDVTIDGNGKTIDGDKHNTIWVQGQLKNIEIYDLKIKNAHWGITLFDTHNAVIQDNYIEGKYGGIVGWGGKNIIIKDNYLDTCDISLSDVDDSVIKNNIVTYSEKCDIMITGNNNIISQNDLPSGCQIKTT